jgi:hypothetical protein
VHDLLGHRDPSTTSPYARVVDLSGCAVRMDTSAVWPIEIAP